MKRFKLLRHKIVGAALVATVLFEWPAIQERAQQATAQETRSTDAQGQQLAQACMLCVIVVVVGGVIYICYYLNSCFPISPHPTTPPPTNNPTGYSVMLVSSHGAAGSPQMSMTLTNFAGWGIPSQDVWLDPSGNRYYAAWSASTPTNLLFSTNLSQWQLANISVTGWVSTATMVYVVYDNGQPQSTNWASVTMTNGVCTTSNQTNTIPRQYQQAFYRLSQ